MGCIDGGGGYLCPFSDLKAPPMLENDLPVMLPHLLL